MGEGVVVVCGGGGGEGGPLVESESSVQRPCHAVYHATKSDAVAQRSKYSPLPRFALLAPLPTSSHCETMRKAAGKDKRKLAEASLCFSRLQRQRQQGQLTKDSRRITQFRQVSSMTSLSPPPSLPLPLPPPPSL